MKMKSILTFGGMALLAVSCAHKQVSEPAKTTLEAPVVKAEDKSKKAAPSEAKNAGDLSVSCALGSDNRTITLERDGKRCEVHYTKFGNLDSVAWAEKTQSLCDKVFDNVRTNIEKGGFKCEAEGQNTASAAN